MLVHRLANIRAKAPTLDATRAAADRFTNTYRREYPAAVGCFADNPDALLAIHRVPVRHRIRVRTTNLAERSFVEERRRTKMIPRLTDEKTTMNLVFATMIRTADRWCRVSISDLSNATSSSCCAPSSDSTRHLPPTNTPPAAARRQPHDQQITDLQDT